MSQLTLSFPVCVILLHTCSQVLDWMQHWSRYLSGNRLYAGLGYDFDACISIRACFCNRLRFYNILMLKQCRLDKQQESHWLVIQQDCGNGDYRELTCFCNTWFYACCANGCIILARSWINTTSRLCSGLSCNVLGYEA